MTSTAVSISVGMYFAQVLVKAEANKQKRS
ncbi:hypothetical protein SAMN04487900_12537 [Prevotella communis]|uniref:Uncharacterized protein n=1 Tax=Prevotella communis TaxID=2913614 RepID=A0A1H0KFC3_9BACT|nr:hypothetical protein SAMN04487900_12537 [Prevotella communis]